MPGNIVEHMLFDRNPRWYTALSNAILQAIFQLCPHPPTQNAAKLIKIPSSLRKKLNDSTSTKNIKSITTAPGLTALTNNNLRLKVPGWRLWAYIDGSSLTFMGQQHIGAGVVLLGAKTAVCADPGGVGVSNTINRAETTAVASAPRAKFTHIATDSACSLSQVRKQLLYPELHRKHTHVKSLNKSSP